MSESACSVRPFNIPQGSILNGYRIEESLGCGWTAEVFKVKEVISCAYRTLKVFANYENRQHIMNQRRVADYANGLEQLSGFLLTPRYYHSGCCFIEDRLGNYFVSQEYINGHKPTKENLHRADVDDFLKRLSRAHSEVGLVIGDWHESNIRVEESGRVRLIDADLGTDKGREGDPGRDLKAAISLFKKLGANIR